MPSSTHRTPLLTLVRERWVAIVLLILTVAFVAQNRNRVDLNLFWIHWRMQLWFVLLVMAAVGAVIGYIVSRQRRR